MALSSKAADVYDRITAGVTPLGELRRIAKEIKTDHALAMELWSTGELTARQLAILVMDKKCLTEDVLDDLDRDLQQHTLDERTQLMDWLMANQLSKSRAGTQLMTSWEHSPSPLQRRIFWYYQARLRWTGQTPPDNTEALLASIEARLAGEEPEVQWAMNFTAGQIGIFQAEHRDRCVALGERLGLYRDDPVPRGCTPNFLPEFIRIQVEKQG